MTSEHQPTDQELLNSAIPYAEIIIQLLTIGFNDNHINTVVQIKPTAEYLNTFFEHDTYQHLDSDKKASVDKTLMQLKMLPFWQLIHLLGWQYKIDDLFKRLEKVRELYLPDEFMQLPEDSRKSAYLQLPTFTQVYDDQMDWIALDAERILMSNVNAEIYSSSAIFKFYCEIQLPNRYYENDTDLARLVHKLEEINTEKSIYIAAMLLFGQIESFWNLESASEEKRMHDGLELVKKAMRNNPGSSIFAKLILMTLFNGVHFQEKYHLSEMTKRPVCMIFSTEEIENYRLFMPVSKKLVEHPRRHLALKPS